MIKYSKTVIIVVILLVILNFTSTIQAETSENQNSPWLEMNDPIVLMSNELIELHWNTQEALHQLQESQNNSPSKTETLSDSYKQHEDKIKEKTCDLSDYINKNLGMRNIQNLLTFSKVWINQNPMSREALTPVCEKLFTKLRTIHVHNGHPTEAISKLQRDYFPGYGDSNSDYRYRKGRELERELLNTFWKNEILVFEKNKEFKGEISVDFFKILLKSSNIISLGQGKPFQRLINGKFVAVVKVHFRTKVKIRTSSSIKYGDFKIWFELLRIKKGIFTGDDWKKCGKTYEVRREYTDESVIGPTAKSLRGSTGVIGPNGRTFKTGKYYLHVDARNDRMQMVSKAYAKCSKNSTELIVAITAPGYESLEKVMPIKSGVKNYVFEFKLKDKKPGYRVYNYDNEALTSCYFQDDQSGTPADKYAVILFIPIKLWPNPGKNSVYMNQEGYGWPIQESVEYTKIDVFYRVRIVVMRAFADFDELLVFVKTTEK